MSRFGQKLRDLLPSVNDTPETRYVKTMSYSVLFMIIFLSVAGLATFLNTLEGDAQTTVPDMVGMELPQALIELQERGLFPLLQLRTTDDPGQRGYVVDHVPAAGALVRSGRRIEVVVSRGAVLDQVPDFIGDQIDDVRLAVRALTGAGAPLIEIGVVQRIFDDAPAGTVLEQDPRAGSNVTGPVRVNLVVSRGDQLEQIVIPEFSGLHYEDVIAELSELGLAFAFEAVPPPPNADGGDVVAQTPRPGNTVQVGSVVNLTINEPADVAEGEVFGILRRSLPEYPLLVELTLEAIYPDGTRDDIASIRHPGGLIGIPFVVPEGTTLVLSRSDETLVRQQVETDSD